MSGDAALAIWTLVAAHGDDDRVRAEPFDAIELDRLSLWGESRQD